MKKAAFKNFAMFTGKLQTCNFIKKRLQHRCFLLNIASKQASKEASKQASKTCISDKNRTNTTNQ